MPTAGRPGVFPYPAQVAGCYVPWYDVGMSYEEFLRGGAERGGAEVIEEASGLRIRYPDGRESWHRLGGRAEEMFDQRRAEGHEDGSGRWVGAARGGVQREEWISWETPVREYT